MNRTDIEDQGQRTQQDEKRRSKKGDRTAQGHAASDEGGMEIERLREVGRNLGTQIEEQMHKRPYVVVGAAAGAGFVLGSLFGSRLGQVLLAAGIGYVVKNVIGGDIGVESPAEAQVELLGPVGIRDRDDHHLELLVHDACSNLSDVRRPVLTSTLALSVVEVHPTAPDRSGNSGDGHHG